MQNLYIENYRSKQTSDLLTYVLQKLKKSFVEFFLNAYRSDFLEAANIEGYEEYDRAINPNLPIRYNPSCHG